MATAFHVYADDGFETSHRSENAARAAAKRGSKLRSVTYTVVKTSVYGLTGGKHGTAVASYRLGTEIEVQAR